LPHREHRGCTTKIKTANKSKGHLTNS